MSDSSSSSAIAISATSEPDTFVVEVKAPTATRHTVTVSAGYLRELGLDQIATSRVVREAFEFLLEREPNTSVLRRFDLGEIERYFPEFRNDIARRLAG